MHWKHFSPFPNQRYHHCSSLPPWPETVNNSQNVFFCASIIVKLVRMVAFLWKYFFYICFKNVTSVITAKTETIVSDCWPWLCQNYIETYIQVSFVSKQWLVVLVWDRVTFQSTASCVMRHLLAATNPIPLIRQKSCSSHLAK